MQGLTMLRRTTIKTLRVVACAESGESVTYSSCSDAGLVVMQGRDALRKTASV